MSAIMQKPGQSFQPASSNDMTNKTPVISVLPKRTPTTSNPPQLSPSYHSPSNTSSPSESTEDHASPTSPMVSSPPGNAAGDPDNSQLPRPVVLPPRAKPGRKPATDTPASKRKAQNREAQRNFRDRKRQREHLVLEQVRQREQEHAEYVRRLQEQHEKEKRNREDMAEQERKRIQSQLNEQSSALELQRRRNEELNAQVQMLIRRQSSAADGQEALPLIRRTSNTERKAKDGEKPASGKTAAARRPSISKRKPSAKDRSSISAVINEIPSPPPEKELPEDAMEIDFTNMGKPSQDTSMAPFSALDTSNDSCGFCSAGTYCACKDSMVSSEPNPVINNDSLALPKIIEPSAAAVGPGGCQACLDDPERRRICLAMASKRQDSIAASKGRDSSPLPHSSTQLSDDASTLQQSNWENNRSDSSMKQSHMTCSDAITYGQKHDPNFHENWNRPEFIDRLRVVRPSDRDRDRGASSPQDVEIASIMAAMSASGDAGKAAAAARRQNDKSTMNSE